MRIKLFNLIVLLFLFGCTHNPFFSDEIETNEKLSFTGNVKLLNTNDHSGVMVYLEGLDIFTETDENGDFRIDLDLEPQLQSGQGLTGFYKVYYYVSNYRLEYSTVFMNKGEFAFSTADLNGKGELLHQIVLQKLLDVRTTVEPANITENFEGNIKINVHLDNKIGPVLVLTCIKGKTLGSAYLQRRAGTGPSIYMLRNFSIDFTTVRIDSSRTWLMEMNWPHASNYIDIGLYDVIPYLHIYQENIPQALLDKIGEDVTLFSPDYLKVPFHREETLLNIREDF